MKKKFFKGICLLLTVSAFCITSKVASAKPGDPYDPSAAASYADSHLKPSGNSYVADYNPKYGTELCAGFVSQCLEAGGMPMDNDWYWKSKTNTSDSWRLSTSLFTYLKNSGYNVNYSPTANDVEIGDVLFYWTNGGWGHVAICAAKKSDGTPLVDAYNAAHYHFSYWTMGYKTCVVNMESRTAFPSITTKPLSAGTEITLSCATDGSTIYYTTDGSTPTSSSKKYTAPFTITEPTTIKAIATSDYKNSSVLTEEVDVTKKISEGIFLLQNTDNSSAIIGANKTSVSPALSLMTKSEEYNCKFIVREVEDNKYSISPLHNGYYLSENEDSILTQNKSCSSDSDKWSIEYKKNGGYQVKNCSSGSYLSLTPNSNCGTKAYLTKDSKDYGQLWKFVPTEKSKLNLSNAVLPSKIKNKGFFSIKGTVSSNYNIKTVQVSITDKKGQAKIKKSSSPNTKSFSLKKIDNKIRFSTLKKGSYTIKITASDETKILKTLKSKNFSVK